MWQPVSLLLLPERLCWDEGWKNKIQDTIYEICAKSDLRTKTIKFYLWTSIYPGGKGRYVHIDVILTKLAQNLTLVIKHLHTSTQWERVGHFTNLLTRSPWLGGLLLIVEWGSDSSGQCFIIVIVSSRYRYKLRGSGWSLGRGRSCTGGWYLTQAWVWCCLIHWSSYGSCKSFIFWLREDIPFQIWPHDNIIASRTLLQVHTS